MNERLGGNRSISMKLGKRHLQYADTLILSLLLGARIIHPRLYSNSAFIQLGLFYDRICATGPFEMAVCPYWAPPYETLILILAALLIASILIDK